MSTTDTMAVTSLAEILSNLIAEEKIQLACSVLGKSVSDYQHLDRGRQAMTGGNLLRNALKKDTSLLSRVAEEAARLVAMPGRLEPSTPKGESSGKRTTQPRPKADNPAHLDVWNFDEAELTRLEQVYLEEERLRKEGKLPPRMLLLVATPDEMMTFDRNGEIKYHWHKRVQKFKNVTKVKA